MQVRIDQSVLTLYPDLTLVVIDVRSCSNREEVSELGERMNHEQEIAHVIFPSTASIATHPSIACWREAYRAFGVGSEYRSSVEALVRRSVKGNPLPRINTIVDSYNLISLKYLIPIGGEDAKALSGDLELIRADGTEDFVPLGTEKNDPPEPGEVIYRDGRGCVCRRFNWREADRTKLTPATKHGLLVLEGIPPITEIDLKEAADVLAKLLQECCGATTEFFLLNAQRSSIFIDI